mgnify:CR=1 FL=1
MHGFQIPAYPIADPDGFSGNQFIARDQTLGAVAQIDDHALAIRAFDDPHDQLADTVLEGLDNLHPLGFAHLLHDHLLGRLGGYSAKGNGFDLFLDIITDFGIGLLLPGIRFQNLALR